MRSKPHGATHLKSLKTFLGTNKIQFKKGLHFTVHLSVTNRNNTTGPVGIYAKHNPLGLFSTKYLKSDQCYKVTKKRLPLYLGKWNTCTFLLHTFFKDFNNFFLSLLKSDFFINNTYFRPFLQLYI